MVDFQIRCSIGSCNKILIFEYFVYLFECYIPFRIRCVSLNPSEDGAYVFTKGNRASCLAKRPSAAMSEEKRLPFACYLHGMVYSSLSRLQSPIFP